MNSISALVSNSKYASSDSDRGREDAVIGSKPKRLTGDLCVPEIEYLARQFVSLSYPLPKLRDRQQKVVLVPDIIPKIPRKEVIANARGAFKLSDIVQQREIIP